MVTEMDTDRVHPRIGPGRVGSRVRLAIAVIFFILFFVKVKPHLLQQVRFRHPITAAAEASGFGFMWLSSAGGNL